MDTYSPAGFWFGLAGPFDTYDKAVEYARLAQPLPLPDGRRMVIEEVDHTGTTVVVWGSEFPA